MTNEECGIIKGFKEGKKEAYSQVTLMLEMMCESVNTSTEYNLLKDLIERVTKLSTR